MAGIEIADDITGQPQPLAPLVDELERRFPGEVVRISSAFPRWPMEAWSDTFLLQRRQGRPWYLKGTSRLRPEAAVLEELGRVVPEHVPHLLVSDLLPDSPWSWFLMEHAGDPIVNEELTVADPEDAVAAVRALARIQRRTAHSHTLPALLDHCDAEGLRDAALKACAWYAERDGQHHAEYEEMQSRLVQDRAFFPRLAAELSPVPSTLVHGDFWAGNCARDGSTFRLLDWADAVWGVGGLSLVEMIGQNEELHAREPELWRVYAEERGISLPPSYPSACRDASCVLGVVTHQQINACCEVGPRLINAARRTFARLMEAVGAA